MKVGHITYPKAHCTSELDNLLLNFLYSNYDALVSGKNSKLPIILKKYDIVAEVP